MPIRFRKSFKVAPGVRLNLSKAGVSTSLGTRGASLSVGRRGIRAHASIPGTGLGYSTNLTSASRAATGKRVGYASPRRKSLLLAYLLWLITGLIGGHRFYLGRLWTGLLMAALTIVGIAALPLLAVAALWWIVDIFLIPRMARS